MNETHSTTGKPAEWPDAFPSPAERSRLQASGWTADNIDRLAGPQPQKLVWVAVVTTEDRLPAVYVSPTESAVYGVVRRQNGAPDMPDTETLEWFQERGMSLHIDSYYVET